jgi:hypothetical protein
MKDEKIKNDDIYLLTGVEKELIQRLYGNLVKTKQEMELTKMKLEVCSQMLSSELTKIREAQKLSPDFTIMDFDTWALRKEPLSK